MNKIKHQIFKYKVSSELLLDIFNEFCEKVDDNTYIFNKEGYKRAVMNETIVTYLDKLLPHYHVSKKHYIINCNSYKKWSTVIRQLCNIHNISYKKEIKYIFSNYEIIYKIAIT